ncbi:hypothetical protein PIB30_060190 [Stylosanthes scabra]|uniref:Uncharacterized protein n=1 Tax=Stylosanthes scabra TaxID=79078 RepID=A0ABU6UJ92_9FABA|nr:hypothetical protein [Stylosanthes scabra]
MKHIASWITAAVFLSSMFIIDCYIVSAITATKRYGLAKPNCYAILIMQMEHLFDIIFHHGGELRWNDDGTRVYEPNNKYRLGSDNELMHMCHAARINDRVVHVYYKHGIFKPYVVEDYVSTAAAANADDDEIAEFDEATFLKTKASHKSSPPNPNPPSNTNPTPVSPKASQKSSPLKPYLKNITKPNIKPISKASSKPKQKSKQKVSPRCNRKPTPKTRSKPTPTPKLNSTPKCIPSIQIGQKATPKINLESNRNKSSQAHHASAGKGKDKLEEESSSGDDDSEESTYKPCEVETSSDDGVVVQLSKAKKRLTQLQKHSASADQPKKHSAAASTKERHDILQDDDGLVEDDSDEDINHGLRDVVLDALDSCADPEESDLWH